MGLFDDLIPAEPAGRPPVPVVGRALLDTIAGSESPGYNVMYGGGKFDSFADHPRQPVPITSGPNAGRTSSAAGRYQFLGSTWDEVKKEANLPDFSPESQDAGAWHLANKVYKQKTGRDLETDLTNAKGNPAAIQGIGKALSGTWTSLPGGIEPNRATSSFAQRFNAPTEVSSQARRVGLFDDLVPSPPPTLGQDAASVGSVPPPLPADTGGRFTDTAGENFRTAREGQSPPVASAGQAFGAHAIKGATLNWADELVGTLAAGGFDFNNPVALKNATSLAAGIYKRITGDQNADAAYRVAANAVREAWDRQREQQPVASIGGEVTGALLTAPLTGGAGTVARGASVGQRALAGAKAGGVFGGIAGAGEGTDPQSRAIGAGTGALIGSAIGAPIGAAIPASATKAAVPTAQELKAAGSAGFNDPAVAGLAINPVAVRDLSDGVRASLNAAGVDEILAPKTFALLDKVAGGPAGSVVTGNNLQTMRRTFQAAAGSPDKTERMAASKVIEAIDNFIPNVAAKDILSGDPKAAAQAWATARQNYAAGSRSEEIAKAVLKAERQAEAAGSGANIDNATRQQFKAILNNDKRLRGFSAEEVAQMEAIVGGTRTGNAGRLVGKAAPTGIVSAALSGGAGFAAGGPLGGIMLPIAGIIGKKIGDRSTANQVAKLQELVASRAPLAKSMEDMAAKASALETTRSPRTISAAVIAARNLSNNLKDAGVNLSPADIMRSLQGGAQKAAAEDQQQ